MPSNIMRRIQLPAVQRSIAWLVISLACWGLVLLLARTGGIHRIEAMTQDWRFRLRGVRVSPTEHQIILVTIDDATLNNIDKPMVFWGPELAQVLTRLHRLGARVIGVDVLQAFSLQHAYPENDRQFAVALNQTPNTVLISMWQRTDDGRRTLLEPTDQLKYALPEPLANHLGYADLYPDADGVLRCFSTFTHDGGSVQYSFAPLVVAQARGKPIESSTLRLLTPSGWWQARDSAINYTGPPRTFQCIPLYQLTDAHWNAQDADRLRTAIANHLVFIGVDYTGCQDYHITPFYSQHDARYARRMSGVEVHANIAATLLDNRILRRLSPACTAILLLLLAMAAGGIALQMRPPVSGLVILLLSGGWLALGMALFYDDTLLDVVSPLLALTLVWFSGMMYRFAVTHHERRFIYDLLGRFVSRGVAEQLISRHVPLGLGGERKPVTILVADIRNFSVLCEQADEHEALALLNAFFHTVVPIIVRYQGTVDKYIGDAIMAVFGAPLPMEDHAARAVCCAIEIRQALNDLIARQTLPMTDRFDFGIGIHTGEAIAGHFGVKERMEYSVVGHAVNLAFRIQDANKQLGTQLLVSEAVVQAIGEAIAVTGPYPVQVKQTRINAFAVQTDTVPPVFQHLGTGETVIANMGHTL